ncbi:MFS transporter [uncultured Albimonas sp.]|uniref:MFS transporter n=1 Tax=uncultured Albimonas sp. TaxID=1331701 RepID=UPI0030EF8330|tara:strand:+ start:7934 stop:9130 length:1197 start_codon:yes stop_codon:yes gene_type:complete
MPGILALGLGYVFSQFYRACLAVLAPYLTTDLGLDAADLGRASGAWFLAFALMQLPVGVGLDRLGPRRTAGLLFGICAAGGSAIFALAQGPVMITVAMTLIGAGCAPALMALFYIYARGFSMARFAFLTSCTVGVGTLGNIAGTEPFALLIEAVGWRAAMGGFAAVSALSAIATLLLVKDPARVDPEAGAAHDRGFLEYGELLRLRVFWPLIPMAIVNYAPAAGIRGLWAGPYLSEVFALPAPEVGRAVLWMAVAMSLGAFCYGPLDRVLGTRKWIVAPGNLAAAGCCLALGIWADASASLATLLLAAIGFVGSTYTIVMAHARALAPLRLVGRTVTLMNFFVMAGVGLAQPITGEVVEAARAAGAPPADAYAQVFILYAAAMVFATVVYLFSRDAKP